MSQQLKPTDLSCSLQVIGAGFSRTGTVSFSQAIEKLLNGPVCHGGSACLMREPAFIQGWTQACDPKLSDAERKAKLKNLLRGYVGTADAPCTMFTKELAEVYPDAKVICTTRDPKKWYESLTDLLKTVNLWWVPYVFWTVPTLRWFGPWKDGMDKRRKTIYPPGRQELKGPEFLNTHNEYVKASVPADRLFFFDVKQGWEPLCKILDVPIPDEPFPHANDKVAVQEAFKGLIKTAAVRWLELFAATGAVVAAGIYAWNNNLGDVHSLVPK